MALEMSRAFLLANDDYSETSSNVRIQPAEKSRSFRSTNPKVSDPPLKILIQLLDARVDRLPPTAGGQLPDSFLQSFLGSSREVDLHLPLRFRTEPKPEKMVLIRPTDGTPLPVNY